MRFLAVFFIASLFLFSVTSCSLQEIKKQTETVTHYNTISGTVINNANIDGNIHAVLIYFEENNHIRLQNILTDNNNAFKFNTVPGKYAVAAFIDSNNNFKYDEGEPASYITDDNKDFKYFTLESDAQLKLPSITITGTPFNRDDFATSEHVTIQNDPVDNNLGRIIKLNDPMFSKEAISMGAWRPITFLETYGGGVMFLQPYSPTKTPVLFVHGINGTPKDFKDMINGLDQTKYQPWVLYYPSGVRLNLVSDYMIKSLDKLSYMHKAKEIIVVAHSMGGLITRSYVKKYAQRESNYQLIRVATINSPLLGMDSAITGVNTSPIVVPSWHDVASNSDFIKELHEWQWPKKIPYTLIFSFLPDKNGDGVVPMSKQLTLKLQDEASHIQGYEAEHTGILSNQTFLKRFYKDFFYQQKPVN